LRESANGIADLTQWVCRHRLCSLCEKEIGARRLFQRRHGFRVTLASHPGHLIGLFKMQAVRDAQGNAGGFQPGIKAILTVVALDHFTLLGIPLGCSPRAGGHTGLAADTQGFIHKYDAIRRPLLHGAGRTGGHTPWVFTVETRHETECRSRQVPDELRTHHDYFDGFRPHRQFFVGLTRNFTGMTANAFLDILK